MKIDTSGLTDWPSPGTISDNAHDLQRHSTKFSSSIDEAHSTWQGLTSCYKAPSHQDLLYDALNPAQTSAELAAGVGEIIGDIMIGFSQEVTRLQCERDSLLIKVALFEAKPVPEDPEELKLYEEEGRQLQQAVNELVLWFDQTVDVCISVLSSISSSGTTERFSKMWRNLFRDTGINLMGAWLESHKSTMTLTMNRHVWQIFGSDFRFPQLRHPLAVSFSRGWDFSAWKATPQGYGNGQVLTRFGTGLHQAFLGPTAGKFSPATVTQTSEFTSRMFGAVKTATDEVRWERTGTSTFGRVGGRALWVAGAAFTYKSEYAKADERFKDERPELTDDERNAKAIETAVVRTGSQVAASAAAGAAIGSAIPVGGTVVGLAVGAAVGLAMSYEWDNGKSAGEYVADGGEAVWTWTKSFFTEDTPAG